MTMSTVGSGSLRMSIALCTHKCVVWYSEGLQQVQMQLRFAAAKSPSARETTTIGTLNKDSDATRVHRPV